MTFWAHKRALVTGGAGFIGRNLVATLLERQAKVRVADNFERGVPVSLAPISHRIEVVEGDLRDAATYARACRDIDVVFHLASKVGSGEFYRRFPADVVLHNVLLDTQVLQVARDCRVGRFLHLSSAFVISGKYISAPWDPWRDRDFQAKLRTDREFCTLRRIDDQQFVKRASSR